MSLVVSACSLTTGFNRRHLHKIWCCVSKNCFKESIPSLNEETSSLFGQTGALLGRETVGVVLIVSELLSYGSCKDFDKKKELPHLVGVFIITPWSSSVFILSQKEPSDSPLSSRKPLTKLKILASSGRFDLPRISDIALKISFNCFHGNFNWIWVIHWRIN